MALASAAAACLVRVDPHTRTPCTHPTTPHTRTPTQINYLVATVQLLVQMKRKELVYKARQRRAEERQAPGGGSGGGGGGDGKKDS